MRVFLANDTSIRRHAGCRAVMRSLNAALAQVSGLEVTGRHYVGTYDLEETAFLEADALLVNGEGTIHHSSDRALFLLTLIEEAKAMGKRVLLVNALFQQRECPQPDLLDGLALLTVREPRSAANARLFGGQPHTLLDSAADPAFLASGIALPLQTGRVIGGAIVSGLLKDPFAGIKGDSLDMNSGSFEDIVATLRGAEIYLTAQHHGVYAAALAGCPFVTTPSNSHKIESFVEWTGLPIPVCRHHDQIAPAMDYALKNRSIFAELKDFMRAQPVLGPEMIAAAL